MVTLRYLEAGRTTGGRVVEADVKSQPATIEIEYTRLLSIASLEVGTALPVAEVRFVLRGPGDDDQTLDLASRRIYHFFEFVEGLRAVSNRASSRQSTPQYAEPPVLRSLSVASPADAVILLAEATRDLIPMALLYAVLKAASALPEKRRHWHEGTSVKFDNVAKIASIRQAELLNEKRELEAERSSRETEFIRALIDRVRDGFPDSAATDEEITRYAEEFILPPLPSLAETGVDDIRSPDDEQDPPGS